MLELTGLKTVLRALGFLYWLLAIVVLALALWKGKNWWRKIAWSAVVIAVFGYLPVKMAIENYHRNAFAKEAWAYFKKLCDEKSGEKIYKTFTGVKGVLVIKPLPPATEKDLYDQYWYGDPYSNATPWDRRAHFAASALTTANAPTVQGSKHGRGFEFVETLVPTSEGHRKALVKIFYSPGSKDSVSQGIERSISQFGIAWEDISTPEGRRFWVAGSRLRVIDLTDNSVVAERIGYLIESGFGSTAGGRRPWLASRGPNTTCPHSHDWSDRWFLLKVFNPQGGNEHGK